jgi:hypothetical protein
MALDMVEASNGKLSSNILWQTFVMDKQVKVVVKLQCGLHNLIGHDLVFLLIDNGQGLNL